MKRQILVIGAGPAGLAVAAGLKARGAEVTVLDRAEAVGSSWRARYDGLRLNTVRWRSHLPGFRIPARMGRWVKRDDFVEYLECYAERHRVRLQGGVAVDRIDPVPGANGGWLVSTDRGTLEAAGVVVATGAFDRPVMPSLPGMARFKGKIYHASEYRHPEPYRGRSVLVVGAGASGLEIATLLADGGAGQVHLSVRSCQYLFPRQWLGIPLSGIPLVEHLPTPALDALGNCFYRLLGRDWPSPLPRPRCALGAALRRDGQEPVVADGAVAALRAGRIRMVPAVAAFDGHDVLLTNGEKIHPFGVIMATGYMHGLERLVGHLGVLGRDRLPLAPGGGRIGHAPRLAFIGFEPALTGRLTQVARQTRAAVRTVTGN